MCKSYDDEINEMLNLASDDEKYNNFALFLQMNFNLLGYKLK